MKKINLLFLTFILLLPFSVKAVCYNTETRELSEDACNRINDNMGYR